jgi:hypothetical protein
MKKRIIWALAGLNVLLLVTLVGRLTKENTAHAQAAAAGGRRPGDYVMIPGEVGGGANAVVYVIDAGNGQLGALAYDAGRKEINAMPPLELSRVFEGGVPVGGPPARPGATPVPTGRPPR